MHDIISTTDISVSTSFTVATEQNTIIVNFYRTSIVSYLTTVLEGVERVVSIHSRLTQMLRERERKTFKDRSQV